MLTRLGCSLVSAWFAVNVVVACTGGVASSPSPTSPASTVGPELATECESLPEHWVPQHEDLLVLDKTIGRAGDIVRFSWAIEPSIETASDDVMTFWCWNGSGFTSVWAVRGVYRDPSAHVYALDGELETRGLDWPDKSGSIVIPDMIPDGVYVLRASVQIADRDAPTPPPFTSVELVVTVGSG